MSQSSIPEKASSSVITDWRPEDPEFWQQRGHRVASRNLWISVPCLLLAFCVWMLFSAVAVNLNKVGFQFTTDQLFMLTALPALSGALLRVPYAFMVPLFGGRRWTAFSTGIMIIPCVWLGFAVQDTSTPFSVFVIISLLCGFAGANFASSMANISFFFPKEKQGGALGVNGGLGNMGVSVMQLVAPLVVSISIFAVFGGSGSEQPDGSMLYLENAAWIWVPFLIIFTLAAWFFMNDLSASKASLSEQLPVLKRLHLWIMALLYLCIRDSLRRVCYAVKNPVPGRADSALRLLRSVYWRAGALDGRGDFRPSRRDPRDAGELRGDGYFLRVTVPDSADKWSGRQLHRLLRGIYGAVPDRRAGQRLYLPDDFRDLP